MMLQTGGQSAHVTILEGGQCPPIDSGAPATYAPMVGLPTAPWHSSRKGRDLKIGHERPDIRRGVVCGGRARLSLELGGRASCTSHGWSEGSAS